MFEFEIRLGSLVLLEGADDDGSKALARHKLPVDTCTQINRAALPQNIKFESGVTPVKIFFPTSEISFVSLGFFLFLRMFSNT